MKQSVVWRYKESVLETIDSGTDGCWVSRCLPQHLWVNSSLPSFGGCGEALMFLDVKVKLWLMTGTAQ